MDAEMQMLTFFENKTVMVVVPHEDDEINVAGSLLAQFRNKIPCDVVFMTNGDCFVNAARRQREAEKSLKLFGIRKEHIIFLGYPDVTDLQNGCVYATDQDSIFVSEAGYAQTYAAGGRKEYVYQKKGCHHKYCRDNCIQDLKNVIWEKKPDVIITNDMDNHPNHRELSILIEEALGEIIASKKNIDYYPVLMKTLAYDLAFYALEDYSVYNLRSTVKKSIWENTYLDWDTRLRLPVPNNARTKILSRNIIYRAMWRHHSQTGYKAAGRIANSDKIFWIRRTDGKAYKASIAASSGDVRYLNDFKLVCTDERLIVDCTKIWTPKPEDTQKKFRMIFNENVEIDRIILYENKLPENDIVKAVLRFSNGFETEVQSIKHDGSATIVKVPVQENIGWVEFQIIESIGKFAGLNEIEVYEPSECKPWFLKLCVGDDYVYEYYPNDFILNLNVVAYDLYGNLLDLPKDKVHICYVEDGKESEVSNQFDIRTIQKKKIVLKAYFDEWPDIYDMITIKTGKRSMRKCYGYVDALFFRFYYGLDWLINEFYRVPILIKKVLGI